MITLNVTFITVFKSLTLACIFFLNSSNIIDIQLVQAVVAVLLFCSALLVTVAFIFLYYTLIFKVTLIF